MVNGCHTWACLLNFMINLTRIPIGFIFFFRFVRQWPPCSSTVELADDMGDERDGIRWLYDLLQEVQLEQFFTRIRDDLQVRAIISFCKLLFVVLAFEVLYSHSFS